MNRHTKRLVGSLALMGMALVASVLVSRGGPSPTSTVAHTEAQHEQLQRVQPGGRNVLDLFDPKQPVFLAGVPTQSAGAAASTAGVAVLVPRSEGANSGVGEYWANGETGEVAIRYGADLVLLETPWPAGPQVADGKNPYAAKQESIGSGSLTTISGYPALVLPKESSKAPDGQLQPPVNTIQVFVDGTDVTLLSPTLPVEKLKETAATLVVVSPSPGPG